MKNIYGAISYYWHTVDKWLMLFWVGASVTALPFLMAIAKIWPARDSVKTQIAATCLGFVACITISLFDYNSIIRLWKLYVPATFILMVVTFLFGEGVAGTNTNWLIIRLFGYTFSIQPSEFLKISFIMSLSLHLGKIKDELGELKSIVLLCLHAGAYILIMYQDTGSQLVFIGIFIVMLFCAGIKWRYIFAGIAGIAAMIPILWFYLLSPDQKYRIEVVRNPELDPSGHGYQQLRGLIALAMGGMRGTGIDAGNYVNVPKNYNDMVFTFIGEAGGFIACLGAMFLLMAIMLKILYDAARAKDNQGKFICIGVFAMIACQIFINLGMCLSVLPVIGVTLPLFSSGGTSVLSLYISLGLVISVYRNSSTGLFSE